MTPSSDNKTVLIIDDDPVLLELFDEILAASFATRSATTVGEAITILQDTSIDAIVSDYHLGTQDANALIDWVVQEKPELISKLILLTGETGVVCNHQDKISSILFKPVDFNTLKQEVHRLFDRQQG